MIFRFGKVPHDILFTISIHSIMCVFSLIRKVAFAVTLSALPLKKNLSKRKSLFQLFVCVSEVLSTIACMQSHSLDLDGLP